MTVTIACAVRHGGGDSKQGGLVQRFKQKSIPDASACVRKDREERIRSKTMIHSAKIFIDSCNIEARDRISILNSTREDTSCHIRRDTQKDPQKRKRGRDATGA